MKHNALFIRVERGYYCINPELSVSVEDNWVNVYEFTGLNMAKKLTEEEKQKQVFEDWWLENEKLKETNPRLAAEQEKFLLDYKKRMEETRKVKLEAESKTKKVKFSDEPEQKVVLKEFVTDKETLDRWNKEDERKKMLIEKHRKDIEDMMKKKPL